MWIPIASTEATTNGSLFANKLVGQLLLVLFVHYEHCRIKLLKEINNVGHFMLQMNERNHANTDEVYPFNSKQEIDYT
ncbi:ATP-dependent helicase/nuclease subunit [Trichinella spiralis]|uniref:ATP-dependent helicase/nuclease subunit n=1 Tax=Trichinella spiralis TaxID=6334 RepID=A0ABR3L2U8_TRISP